MLGHTAICFLFQLLYSFQSCLEHEDVFASGFQKWMTKQMNEYNVIKEQMNQLIS